MVQIRYHGGDCCGIVHICCLGHSPETTLSVREGKFFPKDTASRHYVCGDKERPKETAEARFSSALKTIQDIEPGKLVEVVLITESGEGYDDEDDQSAWEPVLIEKGFKKVNEFVNGNTDNTLSVYHLYIEE